MDARRDDSHPPKVEVLRRAFSEGERSDDEKDSWIAEGEY